jgi:hypothetical protein
MNRHTDGHKYRMIDRLANTDGQTYDWTKIQNDRHTDGQIQRQKDTYKDRLTDIKMDRKREIYLLKQIHNQTDKK